jgi:hypothetical protein
VRLESGISGLRRTPNRPGTITLLIVVITSEHSCANAAFRAFIVQSLRVSHIRHAPAAILPRIVRLPSLVWCVSLLRAQRGERRAIDPALVA